MAVHDITMGSKYRAEIWELVELYLLKGIENITNQENIGIYLLKKLPLPYCTTVNIEVSKLCFNLIKMLFLPNSKVSKKFNILWNFHMVAYRIWKFNKFSQPKNSKNEKYNS